MFCEKSFEGEKHYVNAKFYYYSLTVNNAFPKCFSGLKTYLLHFCCPVLALKNYYF